MQITGLLKSLETPAFVYDEATVKRSLRYAQLIRSRTACRVLYSLKPLSLPELLEFMAPHLDGFAVSSLFEARLARSALDRCETDSGTLHLTTPGIRPNDVPELGKVCDYISFNSVGQWNQHRAALEGKVSCGLRVNPRLSFLDDERYDPCRPNSKLGAPLEEVTALAAGGRNLFDGLEGLLVHTNCDSDDFSQLEETVNRLHTEVSELLRRVSWINLGGGYLFDAPADLSPLYRAVEFLQCNYGLEVIIEPGAAFVRSAGYIVATVLDIFANKAKKIAVLDTTVNHMPEVFEYDFEPDVVGHDDKGKWEYILAGCTCLAGDLFGEYRFHQPLEVGDQVVFCNAGAYTMTKAHTFNGVNLPTIYALTGTGNLELKKRFTYADYASRWGVYAGSTV